MAYLSGYSKYKVLTLTGGASGAQTNFQLKIAVSKEAAMDGEFDDIRFTQADGETLIDAWAEVIVTDTSATVWVEFPTTPANTVEQTYYMYYGNSAVASDWDIDATFIVGDDGETGSPSGDWVQDGTATIAIESTIVKSGTKSLKVNTGGSLQSAMHLPLSNLSSCILEYSMRVPSTVESIAGRLHDGAFTNEKGTCFFYQGGGDAFKYYDTAYHTVCAAAINTWYDIKLVAKSTSVYDIYVDDVLKNADANMRNSPASYNRAAVGGYHTNGDIYIDNFRVRKYAANPPTYAFGAEQSVPAGTRPPRVFLGPFHGPFGGPL